MTKTGSSLLTGCPWRMLPADFPNSGTVYRYYRRFRRDGTLARIL